MIDLFGFKINLKKRDVAKCINKVVDSPFTVLKCCRKKCGYHLFQCVYSVGILRK